MKLKSIFSLTCIAFVAGWVGCIVAAQEKPQLNLILTVNKESFLRFSEWKFPILSQLLATTSEELRKKNTAQIQASDALHKALCYFAACDSKNSNEEAARALSLESCALLMEAYKKANHGTGALLEAYQDKILQLCRNGSTLNVEQLLKYLMHEHPTWPTIAVHPELQDAENYTLDQSLFLSVWDAAKKEGLTPTDKQLFDDYITVMPVIFHDELLKKLELDLPAAQAAARKRIDELKRTWVTNAAPEIQTARYDKEAAAWIKTLSEPQVTSETLDAAIQFHQAHQDGTLSEEVFREMARAIGAKEYEAAHISVPEASVQKDAHAERTAQASMPQQGSVSDAASQTFPHKLKEAHADHAPLDELIPAAPAAPAPQPGNIFARTKRFFSNPWVKYGTYLLIGAGVVYGGYRWYKYVNMRKLAQAAGKWA